MNSIELTLPGEKNYFTEEAYKTLRTNLQFCGQDIRVIAITSCRENEGKSTIAMHIGKSFAELGKSVLVIDADMRKSVLAKRNVSGEITGGLSEVLSGIKPIAECLHQVEDSRMHILFAGQFPPNPVELLSGKYFETLLVEARKVYDYIIIDTPPLGQVIDAAVIAEKCDGVALVLKNAKVHYREAREVVEQLKKADCKLLGVIRNNRKKSNHKRYADRYYRQD